MKHLIPLVFLFGCNPFSLGEVDTGDLAGSPDAGRCEIAVTCAGPIGEEPPAPCDAVVYDATGARRYAGAASMGSNGNGYSLALRTWAEVPVWAGAEWRYLDDGSDPGEGWSEPGYDDSAWSVAAAPLVADSPAVTTWFRLAFDLHSHEQITGAVLGLLRDDGAAVYLNGVEILRDNLAPSAGAGTWATLPADDADVWLEAVIEPALLNPFTNVLAVEVHQSALAPSDLLFDLFVDARGDDVAADLDGTGPAAAWQLTPTAGDSLRPAVETCDLSIDGLWQGGFELTADHG